MLTSAFPWRRLKIYQLKIQTNFLFYYSPWRILILFNSCFHLAGQPTPVRGADRPAVAGDFGQVRLGDTAAAVAAALDQRRQRAGRHFQVRDKYLLRYFFQVSILFYFIFTSVDICFVLSGLISKYQIHIYCNYRSICRKKSQLDD